MCTIHSRVFICAAAQVLTSASPRAICPASVPTMPQYGQDMLRHCDVCLELPTHDRIGEEGNSLSCTRSFCIAGETIGLFAVLSALLLAVS